jgi:hypothetical protein
LPYIYIVYEHFFDAPNLVLVEHSKVKEFYYKGKWMPTGNTLKYIINKFIQENEQNATD